MELKVEYRREWGKYYLIVESNGEDYQVRMLRNNQIPGLLAAEQREWNNQSYCYFDITDCISLKERFKKTAPGVEEIRDLLRKIELYSRELEKYLLDRNDFLLGLEYIYYSRDDLPGFVCLPGYQVRQEEQLCRMLEEIMECMDYRNREAVSLIYMLYSRSRQEDCTVTQLLALCDEIEKEVKRKPEALWVEPQKEIQKEKKCTIPVFLKKLRELGKGVRERYSGEKPEAAKEQSRVLAPETPETVEIYAEQSMETVLLSEEVDMEEYYLEAMEEKQENITIRRFPFYIGKEKKENGYCFTRDVISRKHAKLHREEDEIYLTDLNSKNGTFLNGERLEPMECRRLTLGDLVGFANIYYIFTCSKPSNIL